MRVMGYFNKNTKASLTNLGSRMGNWGSQCTFSGIQENPAYTDIVHWNNNIKIINNNKHTKCIIKWEGITTIINADRDSEGFRIKPSELTLKLHNFTTVTYFGRISCYTTPLIYPVETVQSPQPYFEVNYTSWCWFITARCLFSPICRYKSCMMCTPVPKVKVWSLNLPEAGFLLHRQSCNYCRTFSWTFKIWLNTLNYSWMALFYSFSYYASAVRLKTVTLNFCSNIISEIHIKLKVLF